MVFPPPVLAIDGTNSIRALMQRFSIPWKQEYDTAEGKFSVSDPRRIVRLSLGADGKTVTLLNATDPAFAAALETATATW